MLCNSRCEVAFVTLVRWGFSKTACRFKPSISRVSYPSTVSMRLTCENGLELVVPYYPEVRF